MDRATGSSRAQRGARVGVLVLAISLAVTSLATGAVDGIAVGTAEASGHAAGTKPSAATGAAPRTATADWRATAPKTQAVTYRGLRLDVPEDWAVHDLSARPETCVRYDKPAVYLGAPGEDQRCPARAVGRAEVLHVQLAAPDLVARPRSLGSTEMSVAESAKTADGESQELTFALQGTGLAVTAAYAEHPELLDEILAGARYDGPVRSTPFATRYPKQPAQAGVVEASPEVAPSEEDEALAETVPAPPGASERALPKEGAPGTDRPEMATDLTTPPRIATGGGSARVRGSGFDTCAAPSASTMRAWLASPHRTVGIYIGGVNRACPDGNLSAAWVRSVSRMGWRLLPIYVGRQAPCAVQDNLGRIRRSQVARQGRNAANDAIRRAQRFGLYGGTAIYFDMEAYDPTDTNCRAIVLTFLSAWTKRLHQGGYLSGVYSSASSGIRHLSGVYTSRSYVQPDAIWVARWDGKASVWGMRDVPNHQWGTHQRIKQYRGPHTERWGGRTIEIDSNVVDAPLSLVRHRYRVTARTGLRARTGPGTRYPTARVWPSGATLDVVCRATGSQVGPTRVWHKLLDGTYVTARHVTTPDRSAAVPTCRYPHAVWVDSLRVRAGPSTSHRQLGRIAYGGLAYVVCQAPGARAGGSRVWNRLDTGGWVADWYVHTPGRPGYTRPIPRCS